jgi:AraC-like DNA-binding protein
MRVLSLDRAAPVERPRLLRDAFAAYPVPLSLRLSRAGDIHAEFDRAETAFGVVEGFHVEGASGFVDRPACTRDSAMPDLITVHLEGAGHVTLEQDGRFASPHPGDLVLSTSMLPFATHQEWVSAQKTISFAASDLGIDPRRVHEITAMTLSRRDPLVRVISRFLADIARTALDDAGDVGALAPVTLEMTRLLVSTVLGDETRARASGALTLGERIMLFIDLHLDDPELSATMIARAHAISVRYLYVVLRQQQVGLGDHIRARRIAHARRLLAMPTTARMPLVAVAQRCGFADYSSFARTFRGIVGMSPRGFRDSHGTAVHESPDSLHGMPTTGGDRHV